MNLCSLLLPGATSLTGTVVTADFRAWNSRRAELLAQGIKLNGPGECTGSDERRKEREEGGREGRRRGEGRAGGQEELQSTASPHLHPCGATQ